MAVNAKRIETRHWPTTYRGLLAIHAAQRKVQRELHTYLCNPVFREALFPDSDAWTIGTMAKELPFGAIVAVVEIYGCCETTFITKKTLGWPRLFAAPNELAFGNYEPGRFGWLTRGCRKLRVPVPTVGRQGFWNLPIEIEAQVLSQI